MFLFPVSMSHFHFYLRTCFTLYMEPRLSPDLCFCFELFRPLHSGCARQLHDVRACGEVGVSGCCTLGAFGVVRCVVLLRYLQGSSGSEDPALMC